jgi:GNAT superfamily N-acetyltransferase
MAAGSCNCLVNQLQDRIPAAPAARHRHRSVARGGLNRPLERPAGGPRAGVGWSVLDRPGRDPRRVVGGHGSRRPRRPPRRVYYLAVTPGARGRGHGRAMMDDGVLSRNVRPDSPSTAVRQALGSTHDRSDATLDQIGIALTRRSLASFRLGPVRTRAGGGAAAAIATPRAPRPTPAGSRQPVRSAARPPRRPAPVRRRAPPGAA